MKREFLWCLTTVVFLLAVPSEGIHGSVGGSKMCLDLSLQSLPVVSSKYRRLHILNGRSRHSLDAVLHCRVKSVKFLAGTGTTSKSLAKYSSSRWFTKKDNNRLKLVLRNDLQLPIDAKVIVELNYKGQNCILSTSVNSHVNDKVKWKRYKRKLLSLNSNSRIVGNQASLHMIAVWMAVVAVITLTVVLAMCACHKNNFKKTLSDEVGGTEDNHQVVGISSFNNIQEESKTVQRTNTNNSKDSEMISAQEDSCTRNASNSSQKHEITVQSSTKIEEISIAAPNSKSMESKDERSQSTKEPTYSDPTDTTGLSQSDTFLYKGNEANIATSSHSRKQPVQHISRKDSGKKENKETIVNRKSKKSWLRRKSTKTKSDPENPSMKEKKTNSSRHSDIPLPPTPDGKDAPVFTEEENQYEAVETRQKRVEKTAEIHTIPKDSCQSLELYACIDEEDKAKRNSSGSHMYDVVETREKQPSNDNNGLEYAYTVVGPKDNPIQPSQTSSGSGLYEVVTDEMKKNIPLVQVENDYAMVQKDSSNKKSSKPNQTTRPLSDTNLAPAPPPVTDMPSVKRRTQSEGENLHVSVDEPSTSLLEEPRQKLEHMYAKVNKLRKTSHPDNVESTRNVVSLKEGLSDEYEEPPPIPPSIYAELPMKGDDIEDNMTTTTVDSMARVMDEIVEPSMNSSDNVVKPQVPDIQRNSLSNVNVLCDGVNGEKPVTISVNSQSAIPLYDEIHYV